MALRVKNQFDNVALVKDIDDLLIHIANIVNQYKVDLKRDEAVVRVEKFHRYDRKLISKTSRDARLFSLRNGDVFPNKLYSYEYEDDINIYENRFVASLLLALKKEISDSYYLRFSDNLPFLKAGISYGDYGTYQLLEKYAVNSKSQKEQDKEDLNVDLLNKINALLQRDFFKRVTLISLHDVNVTNLLIGDPDYSACYQFYKNGINRSQAYKQQIIKDLKKKLKNDKNLNPDDKDMIAYLKEDFIYRLKFHEDMSLTLVNTFIDGRIDYQLDFRIGLFSNHLMIKIDDNQVKLDIEDVDNVVEIFNSLSIAVRYKENTCPVCLKPLDEDACHCEHCNSKFKIVEADKKKYAWIYNPFELIWRNE